jgi:thiol-disulfide isomerase/thioredoxin
LSDYASFAEAERYYYLVKNYTGVFRDRLITDFLLKFVFYLKNNNEVLTDAVSLVKDPLSSKIITNIYDSQSVGRPAYDFSLRDIHGKTVRLSDFRGKIVFIDLWFTGCGACQGFYKYQLSRVEQHFRNDPNVVFITVSIDVHADQWTHSVESGDYSSPDKANVVNLYTNGEGADHPMIRAYNVKGYPHPFMIDRTGKIYRINELQAVAEDLIPIIDKAIGFRS